MIQFTRECFFVISDVTNVGADINYWCEWPQQQGRFVESTKAIESWPVLVLNFLESKLVWSNVQQQPRNIEEVEKLIRSKKLRDGFVGHKMGEFCFFSHFQ